MIILNDDIKVNYYRVREGTSLHKAITEYLEKCDKFVGQAEALVKKYKADSAVMQVDWFKMRVSGLNFTDEDAPLRWNMNSFGHFGPKWNSKAAQDFNIELPHFSSFYKQSPEDLRFGTIGNTIIIAVTPNKDSSACYVEDADLLDDAGLETLKEDAVLSEQVDYIKQLGRYYWTPAPLSQTKAFTPSDKINELNQERFNLTRDWKLTMKHSQKGRFIRRALQHLGL